MPKLAAAGLENVILEGKRVVNVACVAVHDEPPEQEVLAEGVFGMRMRA